MKLDMAIAATVERATSSTASNDGEVNENSRA